MAITLRLQWLEHCVRIVKFTLVRHPEVIGMFIEGAVAYVQNSTYDTLANRRDAARIAVNIVWRELLSKTYSSHQMKHFLVDAGVPDSVLEEVPDILEPLV